MNGLEAMNKQSNKGKWEKHIEILLQNALECPASHR